MSAMRNERMSVSIARRTMRPEVASDGRFLAGASDHRHDRPRRAQEVTVHIDDPSIGRQASRIALDADIQLTTYLRRSGPQARRSAKPPGERLLGMADMVPHRPFGCVRIALGDRVQDRLMLGEAAPMLLLVRGHLP